MIEFFNLFMNDADTFVGTVFALAALVLTSVLVFTMVKNDIF